MAGLRLANPELMIVRIRPDAGVHAASARAVLDARPGLLGAARSRLPGGESEARRRQEADPPGLLDQLLGPRRRRRAARPHEPATGWSSTSSWCATPTRQPPALTPRLFMLKEGDRLFIGEKIAGHFTLDPVKPTDKVVFLSTGTGEAPHNYMLWELLRTRPPGPDPGRLLRPLPARPRLPADRRRS